MPRNPNIPDPTPSRASRIFTDRESYQSAFWNRYRTVVPQKQSVLYFYGVGGIGKSALLLELQRQLRSKKADTRPTSEKKWPIWGYVDFQNPIHHQPAAALLQLRESLIRQGGISLPTFDIAYAHYYTRQYHQQVPRGLNDLAGKILNGSVQRDVILDTIEQVPYLGKLFTVGNIFSKGWELNQRRLLLQRTKELRQFLFEQDPLRMTDDLVRFFAADLRAAYQLEQPIILFLDTFEAIARSSMGPYAGARTDRWVEKLASELTGVLVVMAGRRKLIWPEIDPDWTENNLLEEHLIGKLTREDANLYLQAAQIPEAIKSPILDNFRGLPFFLDIAVDLYEQEVEKTGHPPDNYVFTGDVKTIIERLLAYLTNSEQAAVRVLSATRLFSYDLFKELMTEFGTTYPKDRESFARLMRYSLFSINEDQEGHVHDVAREFLVGDTQREARLYLLGRAERQIKDTKVQDFKPLLQLAAEEGFYQKKHLSNSLDAVGWLDEIGAVFRKAGRVGLLLDLREESLAISIEQQGDKHPDTIASLNNLATCLYYLGRSAEALPHYELALEQFRQLLGEDDTSTIILINNLSACLDSLGRSDEALPYYKQALEQRRRTLGEESPSTITSLNNLATCLDSLDRSDEALPYYEQALEQRQRVLGEEEPATLLSLNNLARCLNSLGRSTEALIHHRHALKQRNRVLGEEHPDTITSLNNLALCLDSLNRSAEALPYHKQALRQRRRVLNEWHPHTLTTLNNLGTCLNLLGHFNEALPHHKLALEEARRFLGEEHPITVLSKKNLEKCLRSISSSNI